MAKLALDLSQFKSAGVFTIEIDQSERITVTTQSLRLVPGFSKVGPFNTPVFIRSTRDRQKYYGDIDLKLERKGSFFHRSIDTCLLQSPVFAINLLKANTSPDSSTNLDKVDAIGFSVDCSVANKSIVNDLYINFFNRERFWKADPGYLQGIITNKYLLPSEQDAPLLQLANVGTRDISFIVRKAQGLQGYSVFAKDWYGADTNIPFEWIRPYDLMKDYFIQIIAIEGDWTNYLKLSTDPFFSSYFSTEGILPNKLTDFINLAQVNLIGAWTGTIIPEFRDQTGANQYIEDIVNASTPLTGVLLNVNHEALDQLIWDEDQGQWELGDGSDTLPTTTLVDLVGHNLINNGVNEVTVSYNAFISDASFNIVSGTYALTAIDASNGSFVDVSIFISPAIHTILTGTTEDVSIFISDASVQNITYYDASQNAIDVSVFISPAIWEPSTLTGTDGINIKSSFLSYDISTLNNIFHNDVSINLVGITGKKFYTDSSVAAFLTIGTLVKKDDESGLIPPGVTYITAKVFDGSVYQYETAEPIYDYLGGATSVISQKPIDDASVATHYKFIQLDGLRINNNHLPGYTTLGAPSIEEGVEKIYSMLEDKGILRGLTNPDMIQYRYVVDTMAYGLRPELGGKVYLSRLAKKRGKTTAIISAPSMSQLSSSQNPYFCDMFIPGADPKPIFDTRWIPQGGNPDMPRSFRFSFPTEDNGARYSGIFGPFLKYVDNDRTFLVPPAADVSNTFVRKFLGGDPFAIVANKNGIISNSNVGGVEYNLDQEDRDYLEPFGYNSIIERPQTAQVLIYSNRTSYQTVKSDYNYLHVRELLNTIELQVDEVLKQFVFDYNNPVSRLNVVNSVTPILESIKDAGALYDYEIVMDESNNTKELIDEGFGMIDIGVWINKGMEKIINRITVNKLGTASSGGFTAV